MTIHAKRRLPVEERRALLVEAAGRLFGERGYDATRLEDVATAAGVTKPILYRHFDSKQALYLALLERHREDLGSFVAEIPDQGSLEDRLRVVLDIWLRYVESHSYAWKMLFRDTGGGEEIQAFRLEVHAQARRVLVEIIRSQSQAGIAPPELEPLAELMSMGMGSLVLWWIDHPDISRAAVLGAMTRAWVGILATDEARR
jgi:AcrR family transcriptional regulator